MPPFHSYLRLPGLAAANLAILLPGCASPQANYPSLAIRDAERVQVTPETIPPAQPAAQPPLSAELVQRIAQLQTSASNAHSTFLNAVQGTERLVDAAAGSDETSNRWASAQIALASLESLRSLAAVPLGDLDLLHADAALALDQRKIIEDARAAVVGMIAQEDAILAGLRAKMPS